MDADNEKVEGLFNVTINSFSQFSFIQVLLIP